MNRSILLIVFGILLSSSVFAQEKDTLFTPFNFRSTTNEHYWQNRKPNLDYWQQDIYYKINASVNDKKNFITATINLTYWNNSPDDLSIVYFHLYQNAYRNDSYYANMSKGKAVNSRNGFNAIAKAGTEVDYVEVDGLKLKTEIDNTVMKVYLSKPLKHGDSLKFKIPFTTYFNKQGGRIRMFTSGSQESKQLNCVHWYPRMAVYDRKKGWDTDQHLGNEFYGDFGVYDVSIKLPAHYILDATGVLLNTKEVMPDSLRAKLAIKNFTYKPWNEKPSIIIPYDSTKFKTWKFRAVNVHDFAFTADPTYRIDEQIWNDIHCVALVREQHAMGWGDAASFTKRVIMHYSLDWGMYDYPKMIVADADQGMEYPMLTLDGGFSPQYKFLLAHEIGHNWFFGMLGSNETYQPILDEGFTQFISARCVDIFSQTGEPVDLTERTPYLINSRKGITPKASLSTNPYLFDAIRGTEEYINKHADHFDSYGTYRQVYYKTSTMLYQLEYVLGDSLFNLAMKHYVQQWKFCHPYVDDFKSSIINYTHIDLNWFFDQWLQTTQTIDFALKSYKKTSEKDQFLLKIERKGAMQSPLDIKIMGNDLKTYNYHIPNTWFVKPIDSSTKLLPVWFGWNKVNPIYEAKVSVPYGIKEITLDPKGLLPDINRLNNTNHFPLRISFDSLVNSVPDYNHYRIFCRPDLWFNNYDGVKVGINFNGNYINYLHRFDLTIWYNTGYLQQPNWGAQKDNYNKVSYRFNYLTPLFKSDDRSYLSISAKHLDGLNMAMLTLDRKFLNGKGRAYLRFKTSFRKDSSDLNYLLYPSEWGSKQLITPIGNQFNNTLSLGWDHTFIGLITNAKLNLEAKTSAFNSTYNYSSLNATYIETIAIRVFKLKMRAFAQLGMGSVWASESMLYAAGGNQESMMDNKFTRARGFEDNSWLNYGTNINHFQFSGGLNLRGYAGYLFPTTNSKGEAINAYRGTSGAAINMEFEFDRFFKIARGQVNFPFKLNTYFFGDMGVIADELTNNMPLSGIKADAGIGTSITISKWWNFEKIRPLIIRYDMPFFLSSPPDGSNNFKFRWIIGFERAF